MRLCQQKSCEGLEPENYLCFFHVALFQDLDHNLSRVLCAKFILEESVGGAVECALSSMSSRDVISDWTRYLREATRLLMCDKDIKAAHHVYQWYALILLPSLDCLRS